MQSSALGSGSVAASPKDSDTWASRLAWASLLALLVFDIIVIALHLLESDLDPIVHAISEYIFGSVGWLLTVALVAFALCEFALVAAIALAVPPPRPRIGLVLLTVAGIGPLVAATFHTDPFDPLHPVTPTTSGQLHVLGFVLVVFGLVIAAPLISGKLVAPGQPLARLVRVLAWFPLLGVVVNLAFGMLDTQLGALFDRPSASGLGERLLILLAEVWLVAAACAILNRTSQSRG